MRVRFLSAARMLELHEEQIFLYGGEHGVRDFGLLESALAMPRSGFGDAFFHEDIAGMAAAYLFHIIMNHPFIDGNKRAGLAAVFAFLQANGYLLRLDPDTLYDFVISVATGAAGKDDAANFIRKHISIVQNDKIEDE